ncbi:Tfp pilus assembly protein PilV [Labrenzia sp. EL_195]|nr:Tfp pilus assembly protein PilV [Labrenzia sp. EL_195]
MRSTEKSGAGFTLLETLIAFTVFSLFIIAVHKSFLTGIKGQEASGWSNAIGQVVRSEFALIEAGSVSALSYTRDISDTYRLEVEISPLQDAKGAVPLEQSSLRVARITVRNLKEDATVTFRKIISRGIE